MWLKGTSGRVAAEWDSDTVAKASLWHLGSTEFWRKRFCYLAAFICDLSAKGPKPLCGLSENEAYTGVWSVLLKDFCADSDPWATPSSRHDQASQAEGALALPALPSGTSCRQMLLLGT